MSTSRDTSRRRLALAVGAAGVALAALRCGGGADAPIVVAVDAAQAEVAPPRADGSSDGGACAPRGSLVPDTFSFSSHFALVDARRQVYGELRSGSPCNALLARRSLDTGLDQAICGGGFRPIALSPDATLLAGVRDGAGFAMMSVNDAAWFGSFSAISSYVEGPSPIVETGAPARLTRAAFGTPEAVFFVGQGSPAFGLSVLHQLRGGKPFASSYRLEPRLEELVDVAPAPDGGAWALGLDAAKRAYLMKLTSANELDVSLAGELLQIDIGPVFGATIGVDGAGRVVAFAASFSGPSRLVRLLPNGILDSSFGVDGRVVLPLAGVPGKPAGGLVVERSGAVLTGGIVLDGEDGGARHVGVVRLDERGRLDHTFGGATAPFLLQPGVSVTDSLAPSGVSLLAAPQVTAASGCEPEVVVRFEQRGGRVHVFR